MNQDTATKGGSVHALTARLPPCCLLICFLISGLERARECITVPSASGIQQMFNKTLRRECCVVPEVIPRSGIPRFGTLGKGGTKIGP